MAERINKDNFDEKVLKSEIPVVVDFYSDSFVPCKKLSPVIGDIEDDNEGTLKVYKANVNFDSDLAEQYEVFTVPTLVIFKNGEELGRRIGADRKNVIEEWITNILK